MKHNIKFHKMKTGNGTQLKKLKKFEGIKSFWNDECDNNICLYNSKDNKFFKSFGKNDFSQFILVLRSFGILELINNGYKFLTKEISLDKITENILTSDDNQRIQRYRDSRIICFLIYIKYINNENIHLFNLKKIHFKKVQDKIYKDVKELVGEISWWEKEIAKDKEKLNITLERIEHEWK